MRQLEQLNRNGLFPAPGQSDEIFWAKVEHVSSQSTTEYPFPRLLRMFDINPCWIRITCSNEGLHFWEGAVLWQGETGGGFVLPQVQISERAQRFYSKEELTAHEIIHAVRSDFIEEQFEEVLAYASSPKVWQRWIGPFFRNPLEATVFVWSTVATIVLQGIQVATECLSGLLLIPWLPALMIIAGSIRLIKTQRLFCRCLNNLSQAIKNADESLAVALRLSDAEIRAFSLMKPEVIRNFVDIEKRKNLRWEMLAFCYFLR